MQNTTGKVKGIDQHKPPIPFRPNPGDEISSKSLDKIINQNHNSSSSSSISSKQILNDTNTQSHQPQQTQQPGQVPDGLITRQNHLQGQPVIQPVQLGLQSQIHQSAQPLSKQIPPALLKTTQKPAKKTSGNAGILTNILGMFSPESPIDRPTISTPFNPVHITHVGYDHEQGEFTGLPDQWNKMIRDSGISKQDQASNPQAVLDVIGFMTDTQHINEEDHAFSKFTKIENIKTVENGAENIPTTILPTDSSKTTPRTSPSLPRRPLSPAKPPRRPSQKGDSLIESPLALSPLTKAADLIPVQPPSITKPALLQRSDSASLSKIPSIPVKPQIPTKRIPSNSSLSSVGLPSVYPSKPSVELKPIVASVLLKYPPSVQAKPSLMNVSKPNIPNRPPVPARPAHTLGITSTDITQGIS